MAEPGIDRCPYCGSTDVFDATPNRGGFSFGCVGCLGGIPLAFFWPLLGGRGRDRRMRECANCGRQWRA